jgi:hypothetical protein
METNNCNNEMDLMEIILNNPNHRRIEGLVCLVCTMSKYFDFINSNLQKIPFNKPKNKPKKKDNINEILLDKIEGKKISRRRKFNMWSNRYISFNPKAAELIISYPNGFSYDPKYYGTSLWHVQHLSENPGMQPYILSHRSGFATNALIGPITIPWSIEGLSKNPAMFDYIMDNPDGFDTETFNHLVTANDRITVDYEIIGNQGDVTTICLEGDANNMVLARIIPWNIFGLSANTNIGMKKYILENSNGFKTSKGIIPWCRFKIASNPIFADHLIASINEWNVVALSRNPGLANFIISNPDLLEWNIVALSKNSGFVEYILNNPSGFKTANKTLRWEGFPTQFVEF